VGVVVGLTGCSPDLLIWGPDGARVIDTTERLIDAAASEDDEPLACPDSEADFGEPPDWRGLSAGEPERISDFWEDQADLGATWSINLEGSASGSKPGTTQPGDVFYLDEDGALCVIDIAWATIVSVSD
jgi:hypothetical protein